MDETCDNHCQAKVLQPLDRKSIFLSNRMITVNRIQNLFVGNLMFVQDVVIINRDDAATKSQLSLWQEILTLRCKDGTIPVNERLSNKEWLKFNVGAPRN